MSRSWSQFGLEEPEAGERDRLVLLGGGRGLVLGVPWDQSWHNGKLDDRFFVAKSHLKPDSLLPARGDIVLWRGCSTTDSDNWNVWAAPSRVLEVERHDDRIDVWSLEDIELTESVNADDVDPWFVEHDRILGDNELWSALSHWDLKPLCSRCGYEVLTIMYGMPAGDPGQRVTLGGCMPPLDGGPTAQCSRCGYERHS